MVEPGFLYTTLMIHKVLPLIVAELNSFLKRSVGDTEDRVILSAVVDQSGSLAFTGDNKVLCTVTAIEQERANFNQVSKSSLEMNPPIYFNLYLLFSAYFPRNYDEALKFISLVLYFFQGKQFFNPQNTPNLPEGVDKLTVEINNLDQHAQNQLWSAIGAKMMPSISMKLRMITITREQIIGEIPEVTGIDTSVAGKSDR